MKIKTRIDGHSIYYFDSYLPLKDRLRNRFAVLWQRISGSYYRFLRIGIPYNEIAIFDFSAFQEKYMKDIEFAEVWLITEDGHRVGHIENGELKPFKVKSESLKNWKEGEKITFEIK
jgi:hypothetical protein